MNINRSRLLMAFVSAFFSAAFFAHPADAGMVGTGEFASPAQSERERVKALIARPEVARKLEDRGVLAKDAQSRVDALTDAEVAMLAARIDALPAAGFEGFGTTQWLLVIIAVILLIIAL